MFFVSVAVRSSLLFGVLGNWKKVHRIFNETSIGPCFCKKYPHVQWTMPTFQYDRPALHCVLESVSSNSNNSMLPTSWIIFCVVDFVVDLVEERVDLGGSQFSESILEPLYTAHASQQKVVALEIGNPWSLRSALFAHDLNRYDQERVSPFSHRVFYLQRWMFRFHDKNVFDNYLAHFCVCFNNESSSFFHVSVSTLGSLLSSDERVWITLVSTTGLSVLSEENSFFVKTINIDLLKTGRFFFHLAQCSRHPW